MPECQGTPWPKQARNVKFKWLQHNSNPKPLSSYTNVEPFSQTELSGCGFESHCNEWFSNLKKGRKLSEKISVLKNVEILLKARENVLNIFKSNLFPIMSDREILINEESFMNEINNQQKGTGLLNIMFSYFSLLIN